MPERVKLEEPGSSLVLKVNRVTKENVQNSDYYLFSNGNKELLVPVSSVSRQLANMEITDVQVLVGRVIKLARSTKMSRYGKPFWDLSFARRRSEAKAAGSASAAVPATGNPAGAAGAHPPAQKSYTDLYVKATDFVIETRSCRSIKAAEASTPTATDVHAMVATLFIPKSKE
jgi:hypothetical protein